MQQDLCQMRADAIDIWRKRRPEGQMDGTAANKISPVMEGLLGAMKDAVTSLEAYGEDAKAAMRARLAPDPADHPVAAVVPVEQPRIRDRARGLDRFDEPFREPRTGVGLPRDNDDAVVLPGALRVRLGCTDEHRCECARDSARRSRPISHDSPPIVVSSLPVPPGDSRRTGANKPRVRTLGACSSQRPGVRERPYLESARRQASSGAHGSGPLHR